MTRFTETDKLRIADPSEQRILWDLCAMLEKQLVEPFTDEYADPDRGYPD